MSKLIKIILLLLVALLIGVLLQRGGKHAEVAVNPMTNDLGDNSAIEQRQQTSPTPLAVIPSPSPTQQGYERKPDPPPPRLPPPNANNSANPQVRNFPYTPPPPAPWPFSNRESQLKRKMRRSEIDDVMKSLRTKNLAPYSYVAPPFFPTNTTTQVLPNDQPTAVDHLLGKFEGEIRLDKDFKVWQMNLELSGKTEDQKFIGNTMVEIIENGKTLNKITQTGELSITKKLSDNSLAILLTPFEDHHFQLYYLQDQDIFAGNYYAKTAPNTYEPKGTLRLGRKLP